MEDMEVEPVASSSSSPRKDMTRLRTSSEFVLQKMEECFNRDKGEDERRAVVSGYNDGKLRPGILSDSYKMVLKVGRVEDDDEEEDEPVAWSFEEYHLHVKICAANDAK